MKLADSTLILPLISTGNTPQLAADLLIHTFHLKQLRVVDDRYLFPFVSPNDYASTGSATINGLTTSLQLYHSEKYQLSLLHQRSPILPGMTRKFILNTIIPLIQEIGFQKIVVVGSRDASYRAIPTNTIDDLFETIQINSSNQNSNYIGCPLMAGYMTLINEAGDYKVLEDKLSQLNVNKDNTTISKDSKQLIGLLMDVFEGDNSQDAQFLSSKILNLLNIHIPEKWITPISWNGNYGNIQIPLEMELGIYG